MMATLYKRLTSLTLFFTLLLVLTAFFAVYAYAEQTGEHKELNIDMVPPSVYSYTSVYSMFDYQWKQRYNYAEEATFTLESDMGRYKNRMNGYISTHNLEYLGLDEVYELWLVDRDTGYHLSLGLFTVDQDGEERFSWSHPGYANAYDLVVVTKEPYPDSNPHPGGDVALVGYFDPTSLTRSSVPYGG
jgi:hypothetical protein